MTKTNKIPKNWRIVKLNELIDIHDSKRIPLSEMERINRKGVYPYCGANGVLDYIDDYIFEGEFILFAEDGGYYGKFENSCYLMNGKFWVNNHAHILKAKKNKSINQFLLYMLNFLDLLSYVVGSTRVKLNQEYLKQIKVFYPPLPEQQKIAEIVGTVDKAVDMVDQAIEKTERLKKGLMQELLTKGIGHKEFKDSETGKIPKQWEIVEIKDIGKVFTGKTPSTSESIYWNGNVPFITPEDMTGRKYVDNTNRYVTEEGVSQIGKLLPENTVLVVCIGSTVGKVALARKECVSNQQINAILCNDEVINDFIYYSVSFRSSILRKYSGVAAVPIIKKSLFETFKISLPKEIEEQQKIAEILSTVDKKIDMEKKRKEKLERIKKGLMQDLLTGRRRVKV
jgi:type I restriction enzyme S subunit